LAVPARTVAVIHHGGSGTSQSAARAGVPSIVIPFAGDRFFCAERLCRACVTPAAVDGGRPKAEAFASALVFAADARVRNRARLLGEAMRAENGVADAVAALERIVAG
jgi:sterol 3beta-glucosyltransferase